MSDEQQPRPDEEATREEPAAPGVTSTLPPEVAALLGEAAEALTALATQAAETFTVGAESVSGQRATLRGVEVSVSSFDAIQQSLAVEPQMAFEVQLAFGPGETELAGAFVSFPHLGSLLSVDLSLEQMSDESFATAQGETVSQSVRELLDLVSITLFSEGLSGIEATLAGHHVGDSDITIGLLAEAAENVDPLRMDLSLALPSGDAVAVVLVLPVRLLGRLAERLGVAMAGDGAGASADTTAEGDALEDDGLDALFESNDGPTPLRRTPAGAGVSSGGAGDAAGDGFGLASDPDNVSPFRPAGTFGAATGDDVDVHPVRFPPLPDQAAANTSPVPAQFDLIMDVSMRITVELGRSSMTVEEVLSLGPGSVVELNKLAGEPVDIMVNDRLIAHGEVVVVDENFGVRVTQIVSPRRRLHAMGAS